MKKPARALLAIAAAFATGAGCYSINYDDYRLACDGSHPCEPDYICIRETCVPAESLTAAPDAGVNNGDEARDEPCSQDGRCGDEALVCVGGEEGVFCRELCSGATAPDGCRPEEACLPLSTDDFACLPLDDYCPRFPTDLEIVEGLTGEYITYEHPMVEGGTVDYVAQFLPSGAEYSNRELTWVPDENQVGMFDVVIVASSTNCPDDSMTIRLTISENHAPVLAPIPAQSVTAPDEMMTFEVNATDEDGHSVTLGYSGVLPTGMGFNQFTGVASWTPDCSQAGDYQVEFVAYDGLGAETRQTVEIHVDAGPTC